MQPNKNLLALAGVVSIIFGIMIYLPTFAESYLMVFSSGLLIITGIILLFVAFKENGLCDTSAN